MDRLLFRKRTGSSAQKDAPPQPQPFTQNVLRKSPSHQSFGHRPRGPSGPKSNISDTPPSLDVDIRNSLILPALSQRFSVLLPSLSSAPESDVRDLLASQRKRDGPSLTLEEEELLFEEINQSSWDGRRPPLSFQEISRTFGGPTSMTSSVSDPQFTQSPPTSAPLPTSRSFDRQFSPPPTSNSFTSFETFGPKQSSPRTYERNTFSSKSTLRDAEAMRLRSKNQATSQHTSPMNAHPKLPEIAVDKANEYYRFGNASEPSPSGSEKTATPTSAIPPLTFSTETTAFASKLAPANTESSGRRASLLAGLTPAQVKRISSALGEIQQKLQAAPARQTTSEGEEVEMLDSTPAEPSYRARLPSDASFHSTTSSAFPFGASPTGSSFTANISASGSNTTSPPKLSHSPRSHNLQAHVEPERPAPPPQPSFTKSSKAPERQAESSTPRPILTPSRTTPVKHTPSLSLSSSGYISPVPVYVPGQPRPVGSMHRSEGSSSSRSGTPTHPDNTIGLGHSRSGSTPSPLVSSRTASLGRSRSVNQSNFTPVKSSLYESVGTTSSKRAVDSQRRLSSSQGSHSPHTIEEDEEEEGYRIDLRGGNEYGSRSASRQHLAYQEDPPSQGEIATHSGQVNRSPVIPSCAPSQEGTMDESSEAHGSFDTINTSYTNDMGAVGSPTLTLGRQRSVDSLSSGFDEFDDLGWNDLFSTNSDGDMPVTPADDLTVYAQTLRKMTGFDKADLAAMQSKLVEKAKQERLALRAAMDESPLIPYSPEPSESSHGLPYDPIADQSPTQSGSSLVLGTVIGRSLSEKGRVVAPRRAAPPPPPSDSIAMTKNPSTTSSTQAARSDESGVAFAPVTPGLTRKTSRRVAPENDPEIRKDFEARIAAATAALNRVPGSGSISLSRKFSRSRGAVNISSPRLVSSSANVPIAPLSTTPDSEMRQALEKASGSSGKMSQRWKKLKKGLSFSGDGPQTPSESSILEEPIALKRNRPEPPRVKTATLTSPDINAFKFPNTASSDQTRHRPLVPLPTPPASAPLAATGSISADAPPEQFVKAGIAAGLEDEQLKEMIAVNGLGKAESKSRQVDSLNNRSDATPDTVKAPSDKASKGKTKGLLRSLSRNRKVEPVQIDLGEPGPNEPTESLVTPVAPSAAPPTSDRKVVRRTLLIPTDGPNAFNLTALQGSSHYASSGSPGSSHRKPSIKRKPLNLTREDQQLVSDTPSPHSLKFSVSSRQSGEDGPVKSSVSENENHGLGFLQPPTGSNAMIRSASAETGGSRMSEARSDRASGRQSSGGGSFYDYYNEGEETLVSPQEGSSRRAKTASQAVEITEYADGKLVWSLVDGLRDVDEVDGPEPFGLHSRNTSVDSAYPSEKEDLGDAEALDTQGIAGLNLRHRDRAQPLDRPPTNVYYTSPADVADLIHHLSQDAEGSGKGRIDFLSANVDRQTNASSPFGYTHSTGSPNATLSTVSGQFEDAPSPRKAPPGPIRVDATPTRPSHIRQGSSGSYSVGSANVPAAGFSPKRQLFLRHGRRGGPSGSGGGGGGGGSISHHYQNKNPSSPGAASFATSVSAYSGGSGMSTSRSVEDRLQALLDRLKDAGAGAGGGGGGGGSNRGSERRLQGQGEEAAFNAYA